MLKTNVKKGQPLQEERKEGIQELGDIMNFVKGGPLHPLPIWRLHDSSAKKTQVLLETTLVI